MSRRLACVIGWPVAQSLSPAIHNAAFTALGLDWTYVPLAIRPEALDAGMDLLRMLGVEGANVTMPHKQGVVAHMDELAGDAAVLGAVNTIARDGSRMIGHNTDGPGFLRALEVDAGWAPSGMRALVLGAGGAARAVAVALARAGAAVTVVARRPAQAAEVVALADGIQPGVWGDSAAADLVVNATPAREGLPLDALHFGPDVVAVDLIYPPPPTAFLARAAAAGARAFGGLSMLVHQAAGSFTIWTGMPAPIDAMTTAARAALERAAAESSEVPRMPETPV